MNIITIGRLMCNGEEDRGAESLHCVVNGAGTAVVTLRRPPVNAFDQALVAELHELISWLADDDGVAAVVITGSGDRFASGADIEVLAGLGESDFTDFVASVQSAFQRLESLAKPTIAAINGAAVGGGLELALACDIRYCASDALLGLPEVRLGLLPAAGGTQRLVRTIGRSHALDLLYTGRLIDAETARQLGLVTEVHPKHALASEAIDLADELSGGANAAQQAIKRCVTRGFLGDHEAGLRAEVEEISDLRSTADAQEGLDAFRAKRDPRFGRPQTGSTETLS